MRVWENNLVLLTWLVALLGGCGNTVRNGEDGGEGNHPARAGATGASGSSGGHGGVAQGGSSSGQPDGGVTIGGSHEGGGTGGAATAAGGVFAGTTAGVGGSGGAPGTATAGASGSGGSSPGDLRAVWPSNGCGKPFTGETGGVPHTIVTVGAKDPNCAAKLGGQPKCGAWSTPREYYVYLPAGYNESQPYPLVLQGPGCGGNGTNIYPITAQYPPGTNNAGNTVIRIGLTPGPNSLGHGTNENQGCFDDKEGDDSIDWPFYEALYDELNEELCFDRHRVFGSGNSSGSWFANELACKYAGDPVRPIRGVMTQTGGLPPEPQYRPTCTSSGMAGFWIYETGDGSQAGLYAERSAIERAMSLNGCNAAGIATAQFESFAIDDTPSDTRCRRMLDCDPLYPIVTCPLPGNGHGSYDAVANPGFTTFLKLFSQVPLAP